jgi:O-antigen/teichoic acid export membrane protein
VALAASTRRRALVMADQGVSSLSNVVIAIVVARAVPDAEFGAFAAATIAYAMTVGVSRAVVGEPFLSLYAHATADVRRRLVPDMLGASIVVSVAAALVTGAVGAVVGGTAGPMLVVLAAVLPLMLIQDVWRYCFIVDRAGAALAVDVAWLAGVLVVVPLAPSGAGPAWYVGLWGLTAGLGAVLGFALGRVRGVPHFGRWLVTTRAAGSRFFGEFLTGEAVSEIVMLSVGAIAGLGTLGAVRATQVFYGPLNTIHAGIYLVVVPEGAQARDQPRKIRKIMLAASAGVGTMAVALMAVGVLLPDWIGTALFGDTWAKATTLMVPMGIAMLMGGLATGGYAGVRSLGAIRESLQARLRSAVPQLICPVVGVALAGGVGYALGYSVAQAAMCAVWWLAFLRALAARTPGAPAAPADEPDALSSAQVL